MVVVRDTQFDPGCSAESATQHPLRANLNFADSMRALVTSLKELNENSNSIEFDSESPTYRSWLCSSGVGI
jgi:hypothetical protein